MSKFNTKFTKLNDKLSIDIETQFVCYEEFKPGELFGITFTDEVTVRIRKSLNVIYGHGLEYRIMNSIIDYVNDEML